MCERVGHRRRPVPFSLGFRAHGGSFTDGVCARGCRSLLATHYTHPNKYLYMSNSRRYAFLCPTLRKFRPHPILTSLTCACHSQTWTKMYVSVMCDYCACVCLSSCMLEFFYFTTIIIIIIFIFFWVGAGLRVLLLARAHDVCVEEQY